MNDRRRIFQDGRFSDDCRYADENRVVEGDPIENTTRTSTTQAGALAFLAEALAFQRAGQSPSLAIEAQEKEGQRQLTGQTSRLPTRFNCYGPVGAGKAALEKAGVKFLNPVKGDELWTNVELPEGWKIEPTDHNMWSKLVDDKGRERASIFYKAAFYDRDAHINVERRFSIRERYPDDKDYDKVFAVVLDGGKKEVWKSEVFGASEDLKQVKKDRNHLKMLSPERQNEVWDESGSKFARKAALAWLAEHYPDHESLSAYWDETPENKTAV